MRFTRVGYALGVAAAVAVFAGCSGSGSSMNSVAPGMGGQSLVRNHPAILRPASVLRNLSNSNITTVGKNWQGVKPNAVTTYVVGCQFFGAVCNMYTLNHNTVVGTIAASYVNAMCVDKAGNVWIPDGGAQTISEYAHGSTTPILTLTNTSGVQPSGCAVDTNGTVYVANIAADTITIFPAGHTTPTKTLTVNSAFSGGSPGSGYVGNVAVDESPKHNLIASWEDFNTGTAGIDSFAGAKQANETTIQSTVSVAGVAFDNLEHIVYTDLGTTGTWNVVVGGTVCNSHSGVSSGGDGLFSALNKSNKVIVTGDFINNTLDQVSFPGAADCTGGGTKPKVYSGFAASSSVEGVAISPGTAN